MVAVLKQAELGMAVPRHANLPLTYHPVPDILICKTTRNSRGAGLPRSRGWNRLLGATVEPAQDSPGSR